MKQVKEAVKQMLKENYEQACNGYLVELMRMWEWDAHNGYWVSEEVGSVYAYGDWIFIGMSDIIFCVENDVEEKEYQDWQEYCVFASEYKQVIPNFPSWHKGCPRLTKEQQGKLIAIKKSLDECIEEYKEKINNMRIRL